MQIDKAPQLASALRGRRGPVHDATRVAWPWVCSEGVLEPARTTTNGFDCDRGAPLYWGERKPVELSQDLLFCVDAKFVVDFSPGSAMV